MLADELDFVIGVDTHRDAHALCVVAAASGGRVLAAEIVADERGYGRALPLAPACARALGLGDRGDRLVRLRAGPLPRRAGRACARGRAAGASGGERTWQVRPA